MKTTPLNCPVRILALVAFTGWLAVGASAARRPNILFAISDDQSFPHASAYGCEAIQTPAFDRVAREGVLFNNAFCASPGCSPSRAAFLTGRHTWMIEHAGTHASEFPAKYVVFPDLLEKAGYHVGHTGKGWGPGNFKASGRDRNPAGPAWSKRSNNPPYKGISKNDYAANFADFLAGRPKDAPFYFWYGATEPHRGFEQGSGLKAGKKLASVKVPGFLPDTPEIRGDLLDYCVEIEWFDTHLGRMLKQLEEIGELDNTLVIVTADNGMAFPRAKANCYESGFHVPLAIRWGGAVGGRTVDDLVGFVDLTATILDVTGVKHPGGEFPPAGRSIRNVLTSAKQGFVDPTRTAAYSARERHSSSRYENGTYPQRALRTPQYLLIRNFRPDRWPAGDPRTLGKDGRPGTAHGGYHDIDACPSLDFLILNRSNPAIGKFFHLAVDKRPAVELFDIRADPACLQNLAFDPRHKELTATMVKQFEDYLRATGDHRVLDGGDVWETYKRYSAIRSFPKPPEKLPE